MTRALTQCIVRGPTSNGPSSSSLEGLNHLRERHTSRLPRPVFLLINHHISLPLTCKGVVVVLYLLTVAYYYFFLFEQWNLLVLNLTLLALVTSPPEAATSTSEQHPVTREDWNQAEKPPTRQIPVSYTHLTLPTIYSV